MSSTESRAAAGVVGELFDQAEAPQTSERIDTFDEIMALERNFVALQYLRGQYALEEYDPKERALAPLIKPMHAVEQIGNQFAVKILPAFLNAVPEEGLAHFRTIQPHTTQQEMTLLINDAEFMEMHRGLQQHLHDSEAAMEAEVIERLKFPDGQIAKNDILQFRGIETGKSLKKILEQGVRFSVEEKGVEILKEKMKRCGDGMLPLSEIIKNEKILNINGFSESKVSLVVHDVIDHTWTFNMLRQKGYLDEYAPFLETIGNPHLTNIFLREGEAIASISYGVRYWAITEHGFMPLVSTTDLKNKMDEMFKANQLTEPRHIRAYQTLLSLEPFSREWQSLGFTFSNYITELDEQRRKNGKIKQRDPRTYQVKGELSPMDPDFLSLFIETHHEILASDNKHRDDLFRFHILLEEYLLGIANGTLDTDDVLSVKVQELRDHNFRKTQISPERLQWMRRNYGYTSVKDSVY